MCDKISEIDNLLTNDGQDNWNITSLRLEILDVNEETFKQRFDNLLNNELSCRGNRYLSLCFRVTAATWVFVFGWLLNDLIDDGAINVDFMVSQPSSDSRAQARPTMKCSRSSRVDGATEPSWISLLHEFQGLNKIHKNIDGD